MTNTNLYNFNFLNSSVLIPGSCLKKFPAVDFNVPCALIIGTRNESGDKKTPLTEALREYYIPV